MTCIYVYMFVYAYMYTQLCVYIYVYTCVCVCILRKRRSRGEEVSPQSLLFYILYGLIHLLAKNQSSWSFHSYLQTCGGHHLSSQLTCSQLRSTRAPPCCSSPILYASVSFFQHIWSRIFRSMCFFLVVLYSKGSPSAVLKAVGYS